MSENSQVPAWWIYRGTGRPSASAAGFPDPPPWRSFAGEPGESGEQVMAADRVVGDPQSARRLGRFRQAAAYQADREEISLVNLALHLRRPLLVTGLPGVGKSTLAYSVAYELNLGPVLRWPITSRSTVKDGQYQYDSVGRLQDVSLRREDAAASGGRLAAVLRSRAARRAADGAAAEIGSYVRLGPLGTALLPRRRPRVLLIDEIDKSDVDLPNDLLNVFEEGEFVIPELARLSQREVTVLTADEGVRATLAGGLVRCREFPFVVLTSNDEREFPRAFLRRCIRLEIPPPDAAKLARIVAAHLPQADADVSAARQDLIAEFIRRQQTEAAVLANDQLLNALLMAASGLWGDADGRKLIDEHLLRSLDKS